jgi:hypothetical protein
MESGGAKGFEVRGIVVRRRSSFLVASGVSLGVWMALVGVAPRESIFAMLSAIAFLTAWAGRWWPLKKRELVRVDGEALRVDGQPLVKRRDILEAYALHASTATVRVLPRRRGFIDVRLESEAAAHDLLRALGRDVGQSVVSFSASWVGKRHLGTALSLGVVALTILWAALFLLGRITGWHWAPSAFNPAMMQLPLWLVLSNFWTRVMVGSDGVLLRRVAARRRFVSYADLRSVDIDGEAVVLTLRTGERIALRLGRGRAQKETRDAIHRRITEALAAFERDRGTHAAQALVAPGGRAVASWLEAVRGIGVATGYRAATLDADRLWRIVEDAGAPPGARAGAAVALGSLDTEGRERLRVAGGTVADPRLRVALDCVADDADDAAIEKAMDPLARD